MSILSILGIDIWLVLKLMFGATIGLGISR